MTTATCLECGQARTSTREPSPGEGFTCTNCGARNFWHANDYATQYTYDDDRGGYVLKDRR